MQVDARQRPHAVLGYVDPATHLFIAQKVFAERLQQPLGHARAGLAGSHHGQATDRGQGHPQLPAVQPLSVDGHRLANEPVGFDCLDALRQMARASRRWVLKRSVMVGCSNRARRHEVQPLIVGFPAVADNGSAIVLRARFNRVSLPDPPRPLAQAVAGVVV